MPHSSQDSPRSQVVKAVGFQPTIRKFDSCRGDQYVGCSRIERRLIVYATLPVPGGGKKEARDKEKALVIAGANPAAQTKYQVSGSMVEL